MKTDPQSSLALFSRPYALTRSRLGTETKVNGTQYICTPKSLGILYEQILTKLQTLNPTEGGFSFLLSFDDRTHLDRSDIKDISSDILDTGKRCERLVLKWLVRHDYEDESNEVEVVVRIANPVNPLLLLQAALSKSPHDIDNLEFEMGSTCVSISGAGQLFNDEVFRIVEKWVDARDKPHAIIGVSSFFRKNAKFLHFLNFNFFPVAACSSLAFLADTVNGWLSLPNSSYAVLVFLFFFVLRDLGRRINKSIERWTKLSSWFSVFSLTSGDNDQMTKIAAKSKNSALKLIGATIYSVIVNLAVGFFIYWVTK